MEEAPNKRTDAAASLTGDLLLEILCRVPTLSLFRCKLVSRDWKRLIKENFNTRLDLPTVTGFFYDDDRMKKRHFISFTGVHPYFKFLPFHQHHVAVSDCSNGLILCWCYMPNHRECYVVCNPMTKKYNYLPPRIRGTSDGNARLCFDPTASSHFHVIEYAYAIGLDNAVEIYSSETGTWIYKMSEWGEGGYHMIIRSQNVFVNGFAHIIGKFWDEGILWIFVVDMEGNTWRKISMPSGCDPSLHHLSLHQAQGHLSLCILDGPTNEIKFLVWILEDYGTNNWALKHAVSLEEMFGSMNIRFDLCSYGIPMIIAGHPQWNLFFLVGKDGTIIAYDMDHKKGILTPATVVIRMVNVCIRMGSSADQTMFLVFPCYRIH